MTAALAAAMAMLPAPALPALAAGPVWYDANAVGVAPDWHYRVPVTLPATSPVNSTAVISIDFANLLGQMGVAGTLDPESVRVVRPGGTLAATQEYTDSVYNGATNTTAGRGELRFLVEDPAGVYQVYFDITQNGTKPALTTAAINGNFEKDAGGTLVPFSWTSATAAAGYDAQVRPSENPSISTDGTVVGNGATPRTVDGTPFTGQNSYLLGARTNVEAANGFPAVTLTKTIAVPATNPGNLTFRYRIQGWDSNVNGSTTQYDYLSATLSATGVTTLNIMGPAVANSYATRPFSPNYGTQTAANNRSGYGQYNGWDTDTNGTHRGTGGSLTTLTRGAEPWITVTISLAAFAGRSATLTFNYSNTVLYKSWGHIDDIEWSVVTPTIGSPSAAGVLATAPTVAAGVTAGNVVTIRAQTDAAPETALYAQVLDASGAVVSGIVRLYNDGTHGSSAATPALWVNDGSDPANPTYTIPPTALSSNTWMVRAASPDGSTSTLTPGTLDGLARRIGQASTPISEANFFNVDDLLFSVTGKAFLTHTKSVAMYSDPVNGLVNPKAVPGSKVVYTLTVSNTGGGVADANSVSLIDPIPTDTKLCLADYQSAGQGPLAFTNGTTASGLAYSFVSLANTGDGLSFSNNGGATYAYTPVADADGCDANVTHLRATFTGTMSAATATTTPSFTARFRVGIK